MKPDDPRVKVPELNVFRAPQTISPSFGRSVRDLLLIKIRSAWTHPQFSTDVAKPMMIDSLLDQKRKACLVRNCNGLHWSLRWGSRPTFV